MNGSKRQGKFAKSSRYEVFWRQRNKFFIAVTMFITFGYQITKSSPTCVKYLGRWVIKSSFLRPILPILICFTCSNVVFFAVNSWGTRRIQWMDENQKCKLQLYLARKSIYSVDENRKVTLSLWGIFEHCGMERETFVSFPSSSSSMHFPSFWTFILVTYYLVPILRTHVNGRYMQERKSCFRVWRVSRAINFTSLGLRFVSVKKT